MTSKSRPWVTGLLVVLGSLLISAFTPNSPRPNLVDTPKDDAPKGPDRRRRIHKVIANLLALLATIAATTLVALQQADADRVEAATAVRGYLAAAVTGPFIVDVSCKATVSLAHSNTWDCLAGFKWDEGAKWRKEYPDLRMPKKLPGSFVIYAVDSASTLGLLPVETRDFFPSPRRKRVAGAGTLDELDRNEEDGTRTVDYSAVGLYVSDVRKCGGHVIFDSKVAQSAGIPFPNNCLVHFLLTMPSSSVAVNAGSFAFSTIEFNNASARNGSHDAAVLVDLGIDIEVKNRDELPRNFEYSEFLVGIHRLYLSLEVGPDGWMPIYLNPRPIGDSPTLNRPVWDYLASSKSSFFVTASGAIPVDQSLNARVLLLGALVGVLGSLVASSILALLQAFAKD